MIKAFFWAAKQCRANQMRNHEYDLVSDHHKSWSWSSSDLSGMSGDHWCLLRSQSRTKSSWPGQTGTTLFRRCIQWKMAQIFFQPMFPESVSVPHKREGWRKDLREVGPGVWLANVSACHSLIGRYRSRDLNTGLGLVGANQDGHWLLPPVFILDPIFTLCVVTSLLFAHLCFTPNQLFSTWFPNPWLTLLSTAKSSFFLFSGFLSRGHHLFFSYALVWYLYITFPSTSCQDPRNFYWDKSISN